MGRKAARLVDAVQVAPAEARAAEEAARLEAKVAAVAAELGAAPAVAILMPTFAKRDGGVEPVATPPTVGMSRLYEAGSMTMVLTNVHLTPERCEITFFTNYRKARDYRTLTADSRVTIPGNVNSGGFTDYEIADMGGNSSDSNAGFALLRNTKLPGQYLLIHVSCHYVRVLRFEMPRPDQRPIILPNAGCMYAPDRILDEDNLEVLATYRDDMDATVREWFSLAHTTGVTVSVQPTFYMTEASHAKQRTLVRGW